MPKLNPALEGADMTAWTAMADAAPPADSSYLVFAPSADPSKPLIAIAWYDPDVGWAVLPSVWCRAITHWMPLPAPPDGGTS